MRFDVVVPRRDILVANRPVRGDALFRVRLEVEVAVTIALTSPHQRSAAHVVAAEPVEALNLCIWRILIGRPPIEVLLVQRIVALEDRVLRLLSLRVAAPM